MSVRLFVLLEFLFSKGMYSGRFPRVDISLILGFWDDTGYSGNHVVYKQMKQRMMISTRKTKTCRSNKDGITVM